MGALQGPVFPTIRSKQGSMCTFPVNGPFSRAGTFRSGFWGSQGGCKGQVMVISPLRQPRMLRTVMCSSSSSSNDNGSMAENFSENDDDYVSSSVVQAVKVKSGADGFLIRMPDGRQLRCVHDGPQAGYTAIILKVEDGSDLLLPIIVLEPPLLMAEVRDVPNARSTQCQLMKVMTEEMGYSGKLVRITKREHEAYCAQVYLAKVGDETKGICFDLPPSDAIDIAVRCKVPIQVNKHLAFSDGIGGVEPNHKKGVDKEREQQLKVVADQTPEPEPEPEPFKLSFSSVFEIAFQVMAVLGFVSFFYPN